MFFSLTPTNKAENTHKNIPETIAQAQREKIEKFKPRSSLNVKKKTIG
jgi:hypothetical protein